MSASWLSVAYLTTLIILHEHVLLENLTQIAKPIFAQKAVVSASFYITVVFRGINFIPHLFVDLFCS